MKKTKLVTMVLAFVLTCACMEGTAFADDVDAETPVGVENGMDEAELALSNEVGSHRILVGGEGILWADDYWSKTYAYGDVVDFGFMIFGGYSYEMSIVTASGKEITAIQSGGGFTPDPIRGKILAHEWHFRFTMPDEDVTINASRASKPWEVTGSKHKITYVESSTAGFNMKQCVEEEYPHENVILFTPQPDCRFSVTMDSGKSINVDKCRTENKYFNSYFEMPDENVTVKILDIDDPDPEPQRKSYPMLAGSSQTVSIADGTPATFRSEGLFESFFGISVDGILVDGACYDADSGSTIVTIKPEYIATLSEGPHTLLMDFQDGI